MRWGRANLVAVEIGLGIPQNAVMSLELFKKEAVGVKRGIGDDGKVLETHRIRSRLQRDGECFPELDISRAHLEVINGVDQLRVDMHTCASVLRLRKDDV